MTPQRQAQINRFWTLLDHWMALRDAVMTVNLTRREKARYQREQIRQKMVAELKTPMPPEPVTQE